MMWATIIISGIITFTIRFSAIYKVTNSTTPEWLENILKYVVFSSFVPSRETPVISFNDVLA